MQIKCNQQECNEYCGSYWPNALKPVYKQPQFSTIPYYTSQTPIVEKPKGKIWILRELTGNIVPQNLIHFTDKFESECQNIYMHEGLSTLCHLTKAKPVFHECIQIM